MTSTRLDGHRLYRLTRNTAKLNSTSPAATAATSGHGTSVLLLLLPAANTRGVMGRLRRVLSVRARAPARVGSQPSLALGLGRTVYACAASTSTVSPVSTDTTRTTAPVGSSAPAVT